MTFRIIKDGEVIMESPDMYKIADRLYFDDAKVKMLEIRTNQEEYDKAQAAKG